jgi:hypothetical protein
MRLLKAVLGPLGNFTTPKTYKKKVEEGFDEVEGLLLNARELYDRGDAEGAAKAYREALDELDKHIFRENLPLWDITRAAFAIALFTIPISFIGPWWTVAGIGGAITYTLISTQKVRKESKPKFIDMREKAATVYNDLVIKEKGKLQLTADVGNSKKKRLKKPRKRTDNKSSESLKSR